MHRISDILNRFCECALVVFVAVMTVVVFLEILFRYALHFPLFWTEEFSRYCLVWLSLLGAAIAFKRGEHIAVTVFLNRLPLRTGRVMITIAEISVAVFLLVIFWGGIHLIIITSRQLSPALRISMAIPYSALPMASAVMLIHVADRITQLMHFGGKSPS
ncbi:MAG: TRAP transporter small permease [Deltaproteobacteria bacterium]|nr:TRAP transporter small permease [Deltaproteobacteria bacterium]